MAYRPQDTPGTREYRLDPFTRITQQIKDGTKGVQIGRVRLTSPTDQISVPNLSADTDSSGYQDVTATVWDGTGEQPVTIGKDMLGPSVTEQISDAQTDAQSALDQLAMTTDSAMQDALNSAKAAAVTDTVTYYAQNSSATSAPTDGWSTTAPTWIQGEYIWLKTVITHGDSTTDTTSPVVLTGNTGATGVGVTGVTVSYQTSASGTTPPTGTWSASIPTVAQGSYLWTRIVTTLSDGSSTTGYSIARSGADGADGTPGTDGQTTYLHVAYAQSADGKTGFSTSDPTDATYLGTYTDTTQADSSSPTAYTWALFKGADGTDGTPGPAGRGIASSTVAYQASTSGTSAPTGTWSTSIPTVAAGSYLWTRTTITFTDGGTTTVYNVGKMGNTGATGVGVTGVTRYYASAATPPAKPTTATPTGPWTTTEPGYTAGDNLYYVDKVAYTDGSYSYSDVQLSSSYTAAVTAINDADAQTIWFQQSTTPTATKLNSFWWKTDTNGHVTGLYKCTGTPSTWSQIILVGDEILVPSSVGTTSIADDAITTGKLMSTAIDGMIITGATFKTSSGDLVIDDSGINATNPSGDTTFNLDTATGDATLVGTVETGPTDSTRFKISQSSVEDPNGGNTISMGTIDWYPASETDPSMRIAGYDNETNDNLSIGPVDNSGFISISRTNTTSGSSTTVEQFADDILLMESDTGASVEVGGKTVSLYGSKINVNSVDFTPEIYTDPTVFLTWRSGYADYSSRTWLYHAAGMIVLSVFVSGTFNTTGDNGNYTSCATIKTGFYPKQGMNGLFVGQGGATGGGFIGGPADPAPGVIYVHMASNVSWAGGTFIFPDSFT